MDITQTPERVTYRVTWDNGHACGDLHGEYATYNEALEAGAAWKAEMVALDDDPEEAEEVYEYEVRTYVNGLLQEV